MPKSDYRLGKGGLYSLVLELYNRQDKESGAVSFQLNGAGAKALHQQLFEKRADANTESKEEKNKQFVNKRAKKQEQARGWGGEQLERGKAKWGNNHYPYSGLKTWGSR